MTAALDPKRTIAELKELRGLTADENGAQRVAFTPKWVATRQWLREKFEGLPVEVHTDEAGNFWGTLHGESKDALSEEELAQPGVVKYAGEAVDDGRKAEVYANQFIALHLKAIAGGKTYSELSAASRENPDDTKLAGQVQTAFRGETLRGLLLTTYGFWQLGQEAQFAMFVSFVAALLLLAFAGLGYVHAFQTPKEATI